MKKLEDALSSDDLMHAPLHEVERMIEAQGREVMRALMQAHFDLRSAQERSVEIRDVNGIEHGDVRRGSRKVETKFGEVEFERMVYQAPGTDGLARLDAAMELPDEKYSYEVRRIVAEEAPRASFDEVVELIRKQSGADVPKRQVEELAVRAARDFDAFYRDRLCPPEATDHLLVLSFDAKGIATLHRDLREATRKAAEATPRRLETRLVQGEKPNRKRMAEVATVYTIEQWPRTIADVLHGVHDEHEKAARRPRPTNKRVWASIEHSPQHVRPRARPRIPVVCRVRVSCRRERRSREVGRGEAPGLAERAQRRRSRQEPAGDDQAPRPERERGQARQPRREVPRQQLAVTALRPGAR